MEEPKLSPETNTVPKFELVNRPPFSVTWSQMAWVLVMLAVILALSALPQIRPTPKWEYHVESVKDVSFDSRMRELGAEGWEMVFARRATESTSLDTPGQKAEFNYEMIFKRPKAWNVL